MTAHAMTCMPHTLEDILGAELLDWNKSATNRLLIHPNEAKGIQLLDRAPPESGLKEILGTIYQSSKPANTAVPNELLSDPCLHPDAPNLLQLSFH